MKNSLVLPLVLVAVIAGVSGCAGGQGLKNPFPEITMTQDAEGIRTAKEKSEALLALQSALGDMHDESKAKKAPVDEHDYQNLTASYPRTMTNIDVPSVGKQATASFLLEYAEYLAAVPKGGLVGVRHDSSEITDDGSLEVSGADLYISYTEGSEVVTRTGASMSSEDTLNDTFTMKKINGTWKLTGITL